MSVCGCVGMCAQLSLTLCNPMDCSPPGFSLHGILQARILEWVAISFSRVSSWPRDQTHVSCIEGEFFTIWASRDSLVAQLVKNLLWENRNRIIEKMLHFPTSFHLWSIAIWSFDLYHNLGMQKETMLWSSFYRQKIWDSESPQVWIHILQYGDIIKHVWHVIDTQ